MYKKVVVPLDGSKLAELALPHLEVIGKGCSIPDILLISVTEKIEGVVPKGGTYDEFIPERPADKQLPAVETSQWGIVFSTYAAGVQKVPMTLGKMARTAANYLCKIAKDLEKKGFKGDLLNQIRRVKGLQKRPPKQGRLGRFHQYDKLAGHFEKYCKVEEILRLI